MGGWKTTNHEPLTKTSFCFQGWTFSPSKTNFPLSESSETLGNVSKRRVMPKNTVKNFEIEKIFPCEKLSEKVNIDSGISQKLVKWGVLTNTRIVDSELNYIRNLLRVFLVCKLNMRSFGRVMCHEQLMLSWEHRGVSLMLVCCVGKARWCIWQSCQLKNEGKSSLKFLYFSVHYEQNFKNLYDL